MGVFSGQIERLQRGETVRFEPRGGSMTPRIHSGERVEVAPLKADEDPVPGDVVLCRVSGRELLHLVSAVRPGGRFRISNNRGHVNGWTSRDRIYGRLVAVNPP